MKAVLGQRSAQRTTQTLVSECATMQELRDFDLHNGASECYATTNFLERDFGDPTQFQRE